MKTTRTFKLIRDEDESGVSGIGHVADGAQFHNGWCVLVWRTPHTSAAFYTSIEELTAIHGHNGKSRIAWDDAYPPAPVFDPPRLTQRQFA